MYLFPKASNNTCLKMLTSLAINKFSVHSNKNHRLLPQITFRYYTHRKKQIMNII